ncbi:uncharacterized protein LOC118645951 [Monomorium pharaonis]|uniref:uncharacterized protein LOC118645951 n=1 Tax=Monomorium pharaonis TaxID=307658 RepID=UPI00174781AC|nr:uncharacterized protein LOC118645951 [Monomorium pharaonis]
MAGVNCTVREDRCTDGRNSIITSGRGFARRQQECRATREEPWLCIRKRNDVGERRTGEGDASRRRRRSRHTTTTTATTTREMERRSPGAQNSSSKCSLRDSGGGMRAGKKLGNVFVPTWIRRGPARTTSYSELYHRRFNVPRYMRIQSPEGSTLSICGDSQLEELSLDEGRSSLPGTSRDDNSELSFYRRFVEDHAARVTCTGRSCEILSRGIPSNTERSVSDSKLKKPTYRPYTIEEYRSLSMPRPDRSLGPDKDGVLAKREWLMRRRSYGDSVSARNREQILQRTRRFKSRRAIAQKCFLPPLKDWDAAASKNHESTRIPETNNVTQESFVKPLAVRSKERIAVDKVSRSRRSETFEETLSFGSSTVLHVSRENAYLETLQQRHLQEKELVDRLMRQVLNS